MDWYEWHPYVSVADRRRRALKAILKMKKAGRELSPVEVAGRKITSTFWGDAWCRNLESYSDYANRLPRGRTYVRNRSVIDLQIEARRVRALVSGSDIYEIDIRIKPLAKRRWTGIRGQCAGQINSLVELLRGAISESVMEIVTFKGKGLFPSPKEISLNCSCPDWATMCKHVAATLYGVGARLDREPEMLFTLRGVDPTEMVAAAVDQPATVGKPRKSRALALDDLSSVFGVDIDIAGTASEDTAKTTHMATRTSRTRKRLEATKNSKSPVRPGAKKSANQATGKKAWARKQVSTQKATSKRKTSTRKQTAKGVRKKARGWKASTAKPTAKT